MRNVSSLHNFIEGMPLKDWLERHGAGHGYAKDTESEDYLAATDFIRFIIEKGREFEAGILELLTERLDITRIEGAAGNRDASWQWTLDALRDGREAIYQGLLRDEGRGLFGVPDLIVRCDALERAFPGTIREGSSDGHAIVDIKLKGLTISKDGSLSTAQDFTWIRTQVALYESLLATATNRALGPGYFIGRYTKQSERTSAFEHVPHVKCDDRKILESIADGLAWLDELDANGNEWLIEAQPADQRMIADPKSDRTSPWSGVWKEIVELQSPPVVDAPLCVPARFETTREEWFEPKELEFFVDFETLSNMNDDFSALPDRGGRPMIFMVGCGHALRGELVEPIKVWTAQKETHEEEARILDDWVAHMAELRAKYAPNADSAPVFHWSKAETGDIRSAAKRHSTDRWTGIEWFDLLERVFKQEKAKLRGAQGLGIKQVVKALNSAGKIDTKWGDGPGGGLAATTGAWWCYAHAAKTGCALSDARPEGCEALMPLIEEYNRVDCEALHAILGWMRREM